MRRTAGELAVLLERRTAVAIKRLQRLGGSLDSKTGPSGPEQTLTSPGAEPQRSPLAATVRRRRSHW